MAGWQVVCLGPAVWLLAARQADADRLAPDRLTPDRLTQANAKQTGRLGQWGDRPNG